MNINNIMCKNVDSKIFWIRNILQNSLRYRTWKKNFDTRDTVTVNIWWSYHFAQTDYILYMKFRNCSNNFACSTFLLNMKIEGKTKMNLYKRGYKSAIKPCLFIIYENYGNKIREIMSSLGKLRFTSLHYIWTSDYVTQRRHHLF